MLCLEISGLILAESSVDRTEQFFLIVSLADFWDVLQPELNSTKWLNTIFQQISCCHHSVIYSTKSQEETQHYKQ